MKRLRKLRKRLTKMLMGLLVLWLIFYGKTAMNVNPNANLCIPFMSAHIASLVLYWVWWIRFTDSNPYRKLYSARCERNKIVFNFEINFLCLRVLFYNVKVDKLFIHIYDLITNKLYWCFSLNHIQLCIVSLGVGSWLLLGLCSDLAFWQRL